MKKEKPIIILDRVVKSLKPIPKKSNFEIFLIQLDRWLETHLYNIYGKN